ncbi:MAG: RsmB/NOP family class I SAM-dependent RNA methyltransferase, partial [Phaeodactylibacter sp.]|nr:RsmB/NOP family class I SAM-dependent RNA methyltransferase [Phaeodactylibacter sp.]
MTAPRLPVDFMQQMQSALGTAWPDFLEALEQPPPVSIRLNPGKPGSPYDTAPAIPWHPDGRYLEERPIFTLDPLFHAGAYYVQEASSMLIAAALQQVLNFDRPLKALDLCGAPGGKSTLLASLLPPGSLLLANEVIASRSKILRENLTKWGQTNTFWSQHDSKDFQPLQGYFDLILIDAPCSGEGLFRKTPDATQEWSLDHVQHCSLRQKRILGDAYQLLAPGGILLYSTCTYNEAENSANAHWLEAQGLSFQSLTFPSEWGIAEQERGYQCYPHRVKGEGFFFAVFRAPEAARSRSIRVQAPKNWQKLPKKQLSVLENWVLDYEQYSAYQNSKGALYLIPRLLESSVLELKTVLPRLGV